MKFEVKPIKGPGRDKLAATYITKQMHDKLMAIAKAKRLTKSELMRQMIEFAIKSM